MFGPRANAHYQDSSNWANAPSTTRYACAPLVTHGDWQRTAGTLPSPRRLCALFIEHDGRKTHLDHFNLESPDLKTPLLFLPCFLLGFRLLFGEFGLHELAHVLDLLLLRARRAASAARALATSM